MGAKCSTVKVVIIVLCSTTTLAIACPLLYSTSFSPSVLYLHSYFPFFPVDPAQGQITFISKPFARSLPANPVFGLMSHAPHLPRCGQLGALSQILAKDHRPALWGHHTSGVGVGRLGVPL